jgi:alpha-beta hydrolase superfamily lysophospholipase
LNSTTIASADGTKLRFVRWEAPPDARGQVLLVGGLAEHMGRYGHVAQALMDGGFAVAGIELRGHGHSGGQRGHVERWERYCEDVRAALDELDGEVTILCHSMGGLVSLETVLGGAPQVKALVISNPLLGVRVQAPKIKEMAGRLMSRIWPTLSLGNELDPSMISRDQATVDAYVADKLVFGTITPRWFTEMEATQQKVKAAAGSFKIPLLMMVSEGDQITDPQAGRDFVASYGAEAELKEWGELYHELFNELERDQVLAHVVSWLQAH